MRPLIAVRARPAALAAIGVGIAVVVALGIVTHDATSTGFDTWVSRALAAHVGSAARWALLWSSEPVLSLAVLLVIAVGAAVRRRWPVLALAVLGPALSVGITELVLKPIVGRHNFSVGGFTSTGQGSFPSGHETAVTAWVLVLVLLLGAARMRATLRIIGGVLLVAWTVAAAAGLVANRYHYATDTVGGAGVAVAVVLGVAFAIDRVGSALSSPGGRSPARTSRAA